MLGREYSPAKWTVRRLVVAFGMVSLSVLVAACGSGTAAAGKSSDSSSSGSATGGKTITFPTGTVEVDKAYVPGVPSLADLYKGTENAPPATGPKGAKGKTVVIESCGQAVPACAQVTKAMGDAFDALGWKHSVVDGQLNQGGAWATAARQAMAAHPDAIVVSLGINCSDIKAPLQEAKAAGIPFFGVGSIDCNSELNPGGPTESFFASNLQFNKDAIGVEDLYKQIGMVQADAAIDATKGKAQIIATNYKNGYGAQQAAGQKEEIAKCSDCKLLDSVDWVAPDSVPNGLLAQRFQSALTKYPTANTVLYNYDSTATSAGLARALVSAGRNTTVLGVASEGYETGFELLRHNEGIDLVPSYSGRWIGWGAADMINRYFNHAPNVPQGIGVRLIDRSNVPASGGYVSPIDFEAAYKQAWGVAQ